MFIEPAAAAVPLRRSISVVGVIAALWAAGNIAAVAQTAAAASSSSPTPVALSPTPASDSRPAASFKIRRLCSARTAF